MVQIMCVWHMHFVNEHLVIEQLRCLCYNYFGENSVC